MPKVTPKKGTPTVSRYTSEDKQGVKGKQYSSDRPEAGKNVYTGRERTTGQGAGRGFVNPPAAKKSAKK